METYDSNCLVIDWDILRNVFSDGGTGIICMPTNKITEVEFDLLLDFGLEKIAIKEVQFLIAEL